VASKPAKQSDDESDEEISIGYGSESESESDSQLSQSDEGGESGDTQSVVAAS
jgi:hypothetical protein